LCFSFNHVRRSASVFGPSFLTKAIHSSIVRPVFGLKLAMTLWMYEIDGCTVYNDFEAMVHLLATATMRLAVARLARDRLAIRTKA
jgi:hypothetical protein